MTTHILGISAYYHDSAACLLRNGEIVAAAQEERFTRKKGDAAFPRQAVAYCLRAGGEGVARLVGMRVQLEVEAPAGPGPRGEGPGEVEVVDPPAGELRGEWRGRPGHRLIQQREIHLLLGREEQHDHLRALLGGQSAPDRAPRTRPRMRGPRNARASRLGDTSRRRSEAWSHPSRSTFMRRSAPSGSSSSPSATTPRSSCR